MARNNEDKVYIINRVRVNLIKLSGKAGTVFQCSKRINKANKPQRNYKNPCKLTKNDDEDEYSLALLPEGTVVPSLGGMTLI